MNNSYKPTLGVLVAFMITFSSAAGISTILYAQDPNETPDKLPDEISDYSISVGFYGNIGQIYTAMTDDNLGIKILRYRPPDEEFNHGSQPIILFPALICNINEYLVYSTPDMKELFDIELPTNLADWAVGDDNIKKDPLLYYSMAYYLWKMGYDPWFANFRGIGMGAMRSDDGAKTTSIDDFAIYDVRAAVKMVNQITGLHPIIGGHSTGGLASIMYMEGVQYNSEHHVQSYNSLKNERNGDTIGPETVAGFIGLDPAWIPGITDLFDNILMWTILDYDIIYDLRDITEFIYSIPGADKIAAWMYGILSGDLGDTITKLFLEYGNIDLTNVNDIWWYYFSAYILDKLYSRTLAHYLDFIACDCVREYFKNGVGNEDLVEPPSPQLNDGYFYYSDHTDNIKIPAIIFLATMEEHGGDLVDGAKVQRDVYEGKNRNEHDELYWIEGAHMDMPTGHRIPVDLFPKLGAWLSAFQAV